ncbi:murein biosynthesis integral membrane protein MurJ [Streptomyces montanus]|uniref:Murein biosynthesis integral membrane protein MurJ n=1 Tax=Streptomyces montanus TaxID=2580423 RepID=A0A5R9FGG9_9ACTN|nr:murein biosynthesis integral membrane protein MurJ [Streptomyces montanus]TLS40738.1 murein biosynthesis integral membrane protein MurJ [Streptomyces montanus]
MNAPYEGDHGQGVGGSGYPDGPPQGPPEPGHGQVPPQPAADGRLPDAYAQDGYPQDGYPEDAYPQDPYTQDAYTQDPYRAQDPAAQDPVAEALYDRAAHPPPSPGTYPPQPLYAQPPQSPHAPDPRVWAQTPAPEPEGLTQHLPYGDDPRTTQFVGVDDLVAQSGAERHEPDAFAHLFRDQQQGGGHPPVSPPGVPSPAPEPTPAAAQSPSQVATPAPAPAPKKAGGRASSLLKSSAVMAAGTMVSRLTGFIRSALIVSALGTALLGDTFQVAYQLPTMIYILTVGGGLNSVFVPQLVRAMKEDDDGGEAYANRLLTLVMVALGVLTGLAMLAAPLLVRVLSNPVATDPAARDVGVTFTLYFLPTIFFMGIHVVMGQILNARGRFGAMMWTPVLNNIVIIVTLGMFLWVYGTAETSGMQVTNIPPEGQRLLGAGVLLGLVVQALAMIPYLRETGFRLRLRFDWKGHGLGKAAMLAKWTILFVLANQAGAIVVTQLATAAVADTGTAGTGFSAYANAQLIWGLPQAIITVSLMAALLPRLSRSAHEGDSGAVRDDISQGLRTTAVAIVPISFAFVALGIPMCTLIFGSSGTNAATNMGYMLMAFGLGLIPYSVQYVVLRAFYAYEDTRTPFYNTVIVAAVNAGASALCYLLLPTRWAVAGMAASYGVAYAIGVGVAWRRLRVRLGGDLDGARVLRTYARLGIASVPATLLAAGACYGITQVLGQGVFGSLAALLGGGIALLGVFFVAARRMRIEELNGMVGMVRGRLGR